ncbi:uncharacterized protein [Amphiura filiformis]|uniref:uncharacterized protein isoform X1 n=1 Tax=Amphiura filiformis TaxID=82378 RepID=UPI003B22339F
MIFIMLVSCLFFGRRKRTNPHRTVIREDSSSTVAMKDSRTPTPLGSFYNNNRASFQNGGSRKNGSVQNDSLPEYVHSDSLPESYITDDDNLSSLPSPRDKLNHHDHMELNNISIYTPPPPSPPPSATIPENDLSFIPPPPTPIKPENIASLLNSEPTTIPEFTPPPPTPNKPENIASLLNSEPTTSEDEGRISNPGIEISDLSFNPPPPPPSKPKNIASLLNSEPTTSEDEGGLSNPGVDDVDGERSEFEKLGFTRNPYTSATFIRQGEGWVHDDASFDSYDEEETEEQRQHRAAIDVAL